MVCWLEGLELPDSELLFILQNVLRKVQHQDALQISDVVMASLLRMFQSTAGSGGVQEDALMAVSTLVEGQWATVRQGNFCRVQESSSSHEEFLAAKSIVLSFHLCVIESVQSWSEHEYKFVRNCPATPWSEWEPVCKSGWQLFGGGGNSPTSCSSGSFSPWKLTCFIELWHL